MCFWMFCIPNKIKNFGFNEIFFACLIQFAFTVFFPLAVSSDKNEKKIIIIKLAMRGQTVANEKDIFLPQRNSGII